MKIHYCADGVKPFALPETMVGDTVHLMLSFNDMKEGKPSCRFQRILDQIDNPSRPPYLGRSWRELIELKEGELPVGVPSSHFLDSGSFTLWSKADKYAKKNNCGAWEFYDTDEFWSYVDSYVGFIGEYSRGIDHYANIDVLPFRGRKKPPKEKSSHELTWRNQLELERRGLAPVPVVHFKTPIDCLRRYLKRGHDYIGLGGTVDISQPQNRTPCRSWVDRCFQIVCGNSQTPSIKVHGFGATGFYMMTTFPWHSVDSTSWMKYGAFGNILVPRKRRGQFVFDEIPLCTGASNNSRHLKTKGHIETMAAADRSVVEGWLEFCDVPLGKWHYDEQGKPVEETKGVTTDNDYRSFANLRFFEELKKHIKAEPFESKRREGFGLLI